MAMRIFQAALLTLALAATEVSAQVDLSYEEDPIAARYRAGDGLNARNGWELLASSGNYDAQVTLGLLYTGQIDPKGVVVDYEEGRHWMTEAVAQRDLAYDRELDLTLAAIAEALLQDDSPYKNPAEAVEWLWLAAKLGNAEAGFVLGQLYEVGADGVPADIENALEWYEWSAQVSLLALFSAIDLHIKQHNVGRALYWLDRAYLIDQQGVENTVYGQEYDGAWSEVGYDLPTATAIFRRSAYAALIGDCGNGWQRTDLDVDADPELVQSPADDLDIRRLEVVEALCRNESDGADLYVAMWLNVPGKASSWHDRIDKYHAKTGAERERLLAGGIRIELAGDSPALAYAEVRPDGTASAVAFTVIATDVVIVCETLSSLETLTADIDRAMAFLQSLDMQRIVEATDGVGIFVRDESGMLARR